MIAGSTLHAAILGIVFRLVASEVTRRQVGDKELRRLNDELRQTNALLAELATVDALTGLKNRRYFLEAMEGNFALAVRETLPLSVVLIDLDRFKLYNDSFGHSAGDDTLRIVAELFRRGTRAHDVVAGYGGEEFIVLLPGADGGEAAALAERLREALTSYPWLLLPVTASFGIATLVPNTADAAELLERADQALYRSKAGGGNRVCHADPAD